MHNTQQPQGFYDIYDLMYTPFWRTTPFLILVVLITCVALAWGMWVYWKRRQLVVRTSWEEALLQLNDLQLRQPELDARTFYASLTDVLKKYLSSRYIYSLLEKTDDEIVDLLASSILPEHLKHSAQEIFSRAVTYKFAHTQPSQEQMTADLHKAQQIIQQTIPQQTVPQQATPQAPIRQTSKDSKQ